MANFFDQFDTSGAQSGGNVFDQFDAPARNPADFPKMAANMNHNQMVEAYRATKPGDPWGDFLAQRLQQPMQGETAAQAKVRAGGSGTTDAVNMSTTGKAASTFLQGVPFVGEYADEGLGWLAGKMGLQSEQDATNAIRAGQADMDQSNPKTATGLRIGGGITGAVTAAGALPWYAPQSLGMQALYGATTGGVVGATEGAVSGYGSGTDDASRTENAKSRALVGGVVGPVVGAAAPFVASGLGSSARWLMDQAGLGPAARRAGLSRQSYELLTEAMQADGSLSGRGAQNIAAAGPRAMLADAGPNAAEILDTAIQRSGPAGNLARGRIEDRATIAGYQSRDALDNALGVPRGIDTMEENISTGTAAARRNSYDSAYAQPIDYSIPDGQALEAMLPQIPPDVLRTANRIMQVRREPQSAQIIMRQNPDGSVSVGRLPDVRQWDYISRAMNELAAGQEGTGALGGQTAIGSGFQNWARDIRGTLRGLVPEYGTALDTAGDAIANREALRFGERVLSPATSRDEVARMLTGMSVPERQNMAAGVRSFIDEKLANVTRAVTDTNMDAREAMKAVKDLSSRASREKIAALIGQQEADTLFTQLDQVGRALELRANVTRNSATFARTQTNKMVEDRATGGIMGRVRAGEPFNTGKELWRSLLGGTEVDNVARANAVFSELSDALTRRSPQAVMRDLQRIAQANPRNAALARTIGGLLGYPVFGSAAYQTGTQGLLGAER